MINLDFSLEHLDASLTEHFFEDNPFSLDFSDSGLISLPSENEQGTDQSDLEDGESSIASSEDGSAVVMIRPIVDSKEIDASYSATTDLPVVVIPLSDVVDVSENSDGNIEPLPFEYEDPSEPMYDMEMSLVDAKKKLDACMRRSEHTRNWINKFVKNPLKRREVSANPNIIKAKSISAVKSSLSKQRLGYRGKRTVVANTKPFSTYSVAVRETGNFERDGVSHRSVRVVPNYCSPASKSSSISDLLRRNRKSASISIY